MLRPHPTRALATEKGRSPASPERAQGADEARLEARNLECVRDDRVLFSGLSFSLQAGEMLQVEGRNGSGKTTLLRIICGIRLPDQGELIWCGQETSSLGADYWEHIAYVGHTSGIKRELTPLENLRVAQGLGKPSDRFGLEESLEHVGLYGFEDVPVHNLSAGQQRRVALARLLVTDARMWVLDEPYTALDKSGIGILERLLKEHIAGGGMVALTTHHTINVGDTPIRHINLSE